MTTITYGIATPARSESKQRHLFARFLNAVRAGRMRQVEAELGPYRHLLPRELEQAGWKLTERSEDSLPFTR